MRRLLLAALLVLSTGSLAAQQFDFYGRGPYRAAVPRPDSLLGYPLGSRQTMYYQQQAVLDRMIAAAGDRVRTEVIGRTAEGKIMRVLVISSPENLARLDQIRADLAALADPRRTTPAQARAIAERTPVVVLLTHSVHGNEPAGFEAALATSYQLLASEEPATLDILRNAVVVINPSQNPDGHERFAAWYNSLAVGTDDPGAMEQREPWSIQGRFNHYRFDMNRDMLAQSQLESRALAGAMRRWRPQVVADLHSTTSQYFFPPVAPAVNQNLPPSALRWFERFGRANGRAFDAYGWQYYVRDVFDFFYPGYIDLWPSLSGASGMTFESDGGPALKERKGDGTYMTFRMGIAHHYVASMATLATAAANRTERLVDYYEFHASGMVEARARLMKRVVLLEAPDPGRARSLAGLLARAGIEVTRATAPFGSSAATSYLGGGPDRRTFPAGSYVIDLVQPEARLATAILEPRALVDSAFVRTQLVRFQRNQRRGEDAEREGYEFYDVTAWSLPLTFGLAAWWTADAPPVTGIAVAGDEPAPAGGVSGRAQSAYVFGDETEAGARLALSLLREGFKVAAATQPMVADGTGYPRGTFVVRIQRNPDTVHERIAALAAATGAQVTAVQSAFPDSGQTGIGSESVVDLHAPKVLLVGGDGIDQTSFGGFWFYLERELGHPVTPVAIDAIGRVDLDEYNVILIPNGFGGRLWSGLGENGAARLKTWVRSGGLILAMGGSLDLLNRKEVELTTVKPVGADEDDEKAA
ncbi:MAG: M14 family metallopeptidase, partial [Gemmatimonadales bacterium]